MMPTVLYLLVFLVNGSPLNTTWVFHTYQACQKGGVDISALDKEMFQDDGAGRTFECRQTYLVESEPSKP